MKQLDQMTLEELKVVAFDINQAILKNQNDYQVIINMINKKYEEQNKTHETIEEVEQRIGSSL